MGTLKYFGRSFNAPMYSGVPEIPTPVQESCAWCGEPILKGEAGITMPHIMSDRDVQELPYHIECHLRQALGGLAHQEGTCYCATGEHADLPEGMTLRDEARKVTEKFWGENWMEGP